MMQELELQYVIKSHSVSECTAIHEISPPFPYSQSAVLPTLCSLPHSQQQNVATRYKSLFPNHFHIYIPENSSCQGPLHFTCLFPAIPISLKFISSKNSKAIHFLQSLMTEHPSSRKMCGNQRQDISHPALFMSQ